MTATKRTPTRWPRMKIRGTRRHRLAADIVTDRLVIPYARINQVPTPTGTRVTITALAAYEDQAVRFEHTTYRDGFGRPVTGARVPAQSVSFVPAVAPSEI